MAPEQSQYIWRKTIPQIEVGLGSGAFQVAIVSEIAISPSSSLELVLGPKGNGVTKSSLLLQLDHCSTQWVLLVVCRRSYIVFLSLGLELEVATHWSDARQERDGMEEDDLLKKGLIRLSKSLWSSATKYVNNLARKKNANFKFSFLHQAWTTSPEQSQYIWRKTIPQIEVGMGSGAFQLAIVPEIAISPSSFLELILGPKENRVTKSSLLLQLDHCLTQWVLLVVCRRSYIVFLSLVLELALATHWSDARQERDGIEEDDLLKKGLIRLSKSLWSSAAKYVNNLARKTNANFKFSFLHRAWTMAPKQSQYIWRKTIPQIEVRLGSGAFQVAIVSEIAISPSSSLELVLGPKGNGVTKSSLLLQLDHCSTQWVLLVVCRRSYIVFLSLGLELEVAIHWSDATQERDGMEEDDLLKKGLIRLSKSLWSSATKYVNNLARKKNANFKFSFLHQAWTTSPEQSQYIWRKTIPQIEVGMGSGAFQLAIVPEIAISPSFLELILGPKGNKVTKSSLLLQLDYCST